MRKRLRYSIPSLLQSVYPVYPVSPCELEGRDGEQNEVPIIQEEVVGYLLQHLDIQKYMGPDSIHTRVLKN